MQHKDTEGMTNSIDISGTALSVLSHIYVTDELSLNITFTEYSKPKFLLRKKCFCGKKVNSFKSLNVGPPHPWDHMNRQKFVLYYINVCILIKEWPRISYTWGRNSIELTGSVLLFARVKSTKCLSWSMLLTKAAQSGSVFPFHSNFRWRVVPITKYCAFYWADRDPVSSAFSWFTSLWDTWCQVFRWLVFSDWHIRNITCEHKNSNE